MTRETHQQCVAIRGRFGDGICGDIAAGTRDGGTRLNRSFTLNDLTRQRDSRALLFWAASPAGVNSAENTSYVLTDPSLNAFQKLVSTMTTLSRQMGAKAPNRHRQQRRQRQPIRLWV